MTVPQHRPPQCKLAASGRSPDSRVVVATSADRLPTSKRSGCVIRDNSLTVAGAVSALFVAGKVIRAGK